MNIESLLKVVPPKMLNDLLAKMIPALASLIGKAVEGVELEDNESDIQILLLSGQKGPDPENPADAWDDKVVALVVALDSELNITRHIKYYDLNDLLKGVDLVSELKKK